MKAEQFGAVTNRCSGSVAFDQINVLGRPLAGGIGPAHGTQLSLAVRGEQVAPHVIGKSGGFDDGINRISMGHGILKTFEDQQAGTFTDHQPIGLVIKRGASPGGRQGF